MQALSALGRIRAECRMHGDDLSEQEMRFGGEKMDTRTVLRGGMPLVFSLSFGETTYGRSMRWKKLLLRVGQ